MTNICETNPISLRKWVYEEVKKNESLEGLINRLNVYFVKKKDKVVQNVRDIYAEISSKFAENIRIGEQPNYALPVHKQ